MCALLLQVCVRGLSPCSLTWFFFIGQDVDGWPQKVKHNHIFTQSKTFFQKNSIVEYCSIDDCKAATDLQEHIIISNRKSGLESKKFKVFPAVHHMP